jgi:hypothetical protein
VVVEHESRLVKEAADEGALAVVDTAARDEAQQALSPLRFEVLLDLCGGDGQK